MRAIDLVPPSKAAEQPTAFPAMMTNRATELHHGDRIHQDQEEEEEQERTFSVIGVPDGQSFMLECSNVRNTRKEEQVEILWVVWARNDASRKDVSNLVVFVWPQINDKPDINPTV